MGIQEEIFAGFFKKLEEDEKFPDTIIGELKKLQQSGEITSQVKIFEAITRGYANVREDKED